MNDEPMGDRDEEDDVADAPVSHRPGDGLSAAQIERIAVTAATAATAAADSANGRLARSVANWKMVAGLVGGVFAILGTIGAASSWLVDAGQRISIVSGRASEALKVASELRGRFDVLRPMVDTLKFQVENGAIVRAAIETQIAQNREALAAQVEALRSDREAADVKLARIETQLEEIRSAIQRLESNRRGGGPINMPWRDAQKAPALSPP